jgi:hypothetical protein
MLYVTHSQSLAIYGFSQLHGGYISLTRSGYGDNVIYDLQESDKEDNSISGSRKGSLNEAQRLAEDILRSQRSSRTKTSLADQRNQLVDVSGIEKILHDVPSWFLL